MKKALSILSFFFIFSLNSIAQTYKAYYQENYRWNGKTFISDNQALSSTVFKFSGNQAQIDNTKLTVTNRISNSSGDFLTAVGNDGSNIKVSISLTTKKESNGKTFNCITVERARVYKIVYYIE